MKFYRPTFAEIDLNAVSYNLRLIKSAVGKGVKVLGIVKADAYGHGMEEVARAVIRQGVDYLGVASLDEAYDLRKAGIENNILILGNILPEEAEGVLRLGVTQTVTCPDVPGELTRLAVKKNKIVKVHVKIDTGMGRIGVWHRDAIDFLIKVSSLKNIVIEGIFTHFPTAESDRAFTRNQIKDFNNLVNELSGRGIDIPLRHCSNSVALLNYKEARMNMVRPGLMIYGLYPHAKLTKKIKLKPALALKTRIVYLKDVPGGRSISYGRTHVTKKATKIATIPVGYGDGYSRSLSNKGEVLIRGRRAAIVGRVCMDMSMVDVGHIPDVRIGDETVLIGKQGREIIRVEELAQNMDTIPYEVVCSIGRRVPRVYRF